MSRRVATVATLAALVLATSLVARPARAHVAPSLDDNNRYAKLTPLGDRVRLSYTVFFGERPGGAMRATIDVNHDGQISADEASAFGADLAGEVAAAADLIVDGVATKVTWATVDVGITPSTGGGSFSIDLVAWLCLPTARGHHELHYRDHFSLPRAGETEIKIEDSPGVKIDRARVGALDAADLDFRFNGPGGPFADDGLDLAFTAGPRATITADSVCDGDGAAGHDARGRRWPWVIAAIAVIVSLAGAAAAFSWYRRRTRR